MTSQPLPRTSFTGAIGVPVNDLPELRIIKFRPKTGVLFVASLVFILLAGLIPYIFALEPAGITLIVIVVSGVLAFLGLIVLPFFGWLASTTTITSRRVIVKRGVARQVRQEIYLSQISEIKLRRSLLARTSNSGDIVLVLNNGATVFLRKVPSIMLVAEALQEALQDAVG